MRTWTTSPGPSTYFGAAAGRGSRYWSIQTNLAEPPHPSANAAGKAVRTAIAASARPRPVLNAAKYEFLRGRQSAMACRLGQLRLRTGVCSLGQPTVTCRLHGLV